MRTLSTTLTVFLLVAGMPALDFSSMAGEHDVKQPPEDCEVTASVSKATDTSDNFVGRFVPGGRNVNSHRYVVSPGAPPFPDRTKFVGMLRGSWYEMGHNLGERAGRNVRSTSDVWWKKICDKHEKAEILRVMECFEQQIELLDYNQIEFLKGVTDGASVWLDESAYSESDHALYAENYWRVLTASIWDRLYWGRLDCQGGCNSFAVLGTATIDGKAIATQSQHTPHDGLCYLQSYVISPPEGNRVWTVAATPSVIGLQVVNDKGVSISHHFGGTTTKASREHPGGPYFADAIGVPWWNLVLYAAIHADTAQEAIEILTIGPEKYRRSTGRKTILRDAAWNWLVADSNTLAVVEASADRYAVRYPGDFLDEAWQDEDVIVCANHFLCGHSYNAENQRTDVPMSIFNVELEASERRFWTLMWEVKDRSGQLDKYAAQHILGTTYVREKDGGRKVECAQTEEGEWLPYAYVRSGIQGGMRQSGLEGGTNTAKVTVLDGEKSMASWTLGNPSDWEGAWDEYCFDAD